MISPSAALPNVFSHTRRDAGEYCRVLPQGRPQGPIAKAPLEETGRGRDRQSYEERKVCEVMRKASSLYKVTDMNADGNSYHAEGCAAAYDV